MLVDVISCTGSITQMHSRHRRCACKHCAVSCRKHSKYNAHVAMRATAVIPHIFHNLARCNSTALMQLKPNTRCFEQPYQQCQSPRYSKIFPSRQDASVRTVALRLLGAACCAKDALHNRPNKRTQTYISCTSQKRLPSSVFTSRSRLDSGREQSLVRRDSIDFVRFSFISFSSVSIGVLLFDILPMTWAACHWKTRASPSTSVRLLSDTW